MTLQPMTLAGIPVPGAFRLVDGSRQLALLIRFDDGEDDLRDGWYLLPTASTRLSPTVGPFGERDEAVEALRDLLSTSSA